ncbi:hypothetical protein Dimus_029937 [Dionaea muscipula]
MPSIEEEEVSGGECSAEEDVPELLQASSSSIGDPELHSLSCLVSDSMPKPAVEVEEGPLTFPLLEALEEGRALGSLSVSAARSSSMVSVLHSAHSDGQKLGEVLDSVLGEGNLEADGVILILSPISSSRWGGEQRVDLRLPTAIDLGAGKEAAAKAQNGGERKCEAAAANVILISTETTHYISQCEDRRRTNLYFIAHRS